ncbi:MAG: CRTAC1 family protein [Acidobacteriota bacterium]
MIRTPLVHLRLSPALLVAALSLTASVPVGGAANAKVRFVDVAAEAGILFTNVYGTLEKAYITEMGGSGAGWLDYDLDGWPDLLLVNGLPGPADDPVAATREALRADGPQLPEDGSSGTGNALFRNLGSAFERVGDVAGVADRMWGNGVAVGDVDDDGFGDLYVTAIGSNRLYRNNGDGTFSVWPAGAEDEGWGTSALFTDWDGDGHLDLYVANYVDFDAAATATLGDGLCFYRGIEVFCGPEGLQGARDILYRNNGDGSFTRWPQAEVDGEATYGFALVATDCDGDQRPDIYVADDSTINLLYRHDGEAGIEDWSLFGGAGYNGGGQEQAGMGVTAADYDGDGDIDLYVTNFQHDYNTLYRNRGDCVFEDTSEQLGLASSSFPYMGWAPQFADLDGDADEDLFVANGHIHPQLDAAGLEPYRQRNLLYLNQLSESGEAGFLEARDSAGPGLAIATSSRSAAVADFDDDGDVDLLVTNINARPNLLRNDSDSQYPVLRLSLIGRHGNRDAYGARVMVESGGRRQVRELRASDGYLSSNDVRLLVFLPGGRAERVQVQWPGGGVTELRDVAPAWLVIDELGGIVARRGS